MADSKNLSSFWPTANIFVLSCIGNDLYRRSFGSRTVDRSKDEPLTPDTLSWIASQTKLTASVSVLQLVEKGLVGLDDDVREIIPELKEQKVLLGFEGDGEAKAGDNVDMGAIIKGGAGDHTEAEKPIGKPIFEDVKGKITLRYAFSHTAVEMGCFFSLVVDLPCWGWGGTRFVVLITSQTTTLTLERITI